MNTLNVVINVTYFKLNFWGDIMSIQNKTNESIETKELATDKIVKKITNTKDSHKVFYGDSNEVNSVGYSDYNDYVRHTEKNKV